MLRDTYILIISTLLDNTIHSSASKYHKHHLKRSSIIQRQGMAGIQFPDNLNAFGVNLLCLVVVSKGL